MEHEIHKIFTCNSPFLPKCKIFKDSIIMPKEWNIFNNKTIYWIFTSETGITRKRIQKNKDESQMEISEKYKI